MGIRRAQIPHRRGLEAEVAIRLPSSISMCLGVLTPAGPSWPKSDQREARGLHAAFAYWPEPPHLQLAKIWPVTTQFGNANHQDRCDAAQAAHKAKLTLSEADQSLSYHDQNPAIWHSNLGCCNAFLAPRPTALLHICNQDAQVRRGQRMTTFFHSRTIDVGFQNLAN